MFKVSVRRLFTFSKVHDAYFLSTVEYKKHILTAILEKLSRFKEVLGLQLEN